ncbi:cytochrome c biogenesis protein CcmG, thiol:disulfide interchange protein DsbE [Shimia gijangensis]|uniref:Cytochrome c biogenesis protein CcmG, thiol:disulfide interchange protein DsbE n=1 Tax=Shimia gijangensis TaxID=1470563 RepID=A0A1M6E9K5_9RHOB|nr:DsbE family thiol:disulfide interchange protein [Shimia gijangensis]SHI82187.1 cytochrome c biogenesis protein CcmG, thiol:disulfide interchange protein DsbE [Shimia gijangensis]
MAKISPLMLAPPVLFAGLAALFFVGMQRENPNDLPSMLINKDAPSVAALVPLADTPLLKDEVLRESGLKLVNFWGTWCVACRAEHPTLLVIEDLLPVTLHGVNFDDTKAKAEAYLQEEGNPFTTLGEDISDKTKIDWGVYGAPETFLIDENGKVLMRHAGPITERVIETTLGPAIEKALARQSGS